MSSAIINVNIVELYPSKRNSVVHMLFPYLVCFVNIRHVTIYLLL